MGCPGLLPVRRNRSLVLSSLHKVQKEGHGLIIMLLLGLHRVCPLGLLLNRLVFVEVLRWLPLASGALELLGPLRAVSPCLVCF